MPGPWSLAEARARAGIDIAAGTLPAAIDELAREARVSIGTDAVLPSLPTPRVRGEMTVAAALDRLLRGSGWRARAVSVSAWRIERVPAIAPRSPVRAQVAPVQAEASEPIVVTATKQPLGLLSLPAAVSLVSLDDVARADPVRASADIAASVDGLSLTWLGPGRNRMFLRGVADSAFSGESQSTVAVVLDDARITYAAPDPDIRLVDIERVEVLKGPQGSLYGTGALGGIYRMVTRPVDLDDASLAVSGGGSLVAHGGLGGSGSAVANLPLADGAAGVRFVAYGASEPGWIDTDGRADSNESRVKGARAVFSVVPATGWRLDATGFGQWLTARDSRYVYAPHRDERPPQLAEPHDNDLRHAALRLNGTPGGVSVTLASAMTWHDVADTLDATVGADGFGMSAPQSMVDARRFRVWDSELRVHGNWGAVNWLAGLSHLDASQSLTVDLHDGGGAALNVDDDRRDSHDTAGFLNVTVPITGRLSIDGGARLYRSSIRETRRTSLGVEEREDDRAGMTPTLALAWQPGGHRLVYLRYGSAFRQGGAEIAADGTLRPLKGDELASLELGWREILPGGGRIELSAWYSRWENVQSDVLEDNGLIETASAGDAQVIGVEGSVDLPLGPGWHVEGGVNVTDARLVRNALGYSLEDRRLPVVPQYTLRASLRRDFRMGPLDARFRLGAHYLGPARMSFDPLLDRHMGDIFQSEAEVQLSRGDWTLALSARNLTGARGNAFAFGNPLRYRTMRQFTPQQPPTVLANLIMAF